MGLISTDPLLWPSMPQGASSPTGSCNDLEKSREGYGKVLGGSGGAWEQAGAMVVVDC